MDMIDIVRDRVRSAAHANSRAHLLGSDQVGRLQGVMEMAGIVCYTGSTIITLAKELIEK